MLAWVGLVSLASAETDDNGSLWLNYFGDHPVAETPWALHLDMQVRRADYGRVWQQFLVQPGIVYDINEKVKVAGGYGFMETHPYGDHPVPFDFPEHRIWEQISFTSKLLGVDWQHRFRLEQRFLGTPDGTPAGLLVENYDYRFENRFRYRLQTVLPLRCLGDAGYYLRVYDEVFLNFGGDVARNHFDQNRAYIGVGRPIQKHFRVELGFMEHLLQQRNGEIWENNHTLMFSIISGQPIR